MSRKRVPWDGPNPAPGDYLDCRGGAHVWHIRSVEPLRRPDVSGARICLDVVQTPRSALPEAATVHPASRVALSDPSGPARVRQIAGGRGAVMRAAWRDPEDWRPQVRHAREINGWRTVCQLRRMATQAGNGITERHIAAADQLRHVAFLAAYGYSPSDGAGLPVTAITYGPRAGPSDGAVAQVEAAVSLLRAMRRLAPDQRLIVMHVVLFNGTVAEWCRVGRLNPQTEMGYLIGALDLLEDHYGGEIDEALAEELVRAA
jgi:hypothetical protein